MAPNDTLAFLKCVLPSEGYYCAVIFDTANPRPGVDFPRQQFCSTLEELCDVLLTNDAAGRTVYHACAAFTAPGKRTHANARAARSFWLDVDAGTGKPYPDAGTAAVAVIDFVDAVGLPRPVFVGSGNGVHAYWPLEADLDPQTWRDYALGLKSLCTEKGLIADHSRTADISSILRPPGTHHRKDGEKLVQAGELGTAHAIGRFAALCSSPTGQNISIVRADQRNRETVIGRIFATTSHTACYAERIADSCAQLSGFRASGNISEPKWYANLGILAWCEDGEVKAHEWSARDYPAYTYEATQYKLERTRELTGATTCAKLNDVNPGVCQLCPHWQKINSPISLGYAKPAPAAEPEVQVLHALDTAALPDPPSPFQWSPEWQLCMSSENNDGEDILTVVTEYPVYLDSVQTGELDRTLFSYRFKKFLPKSGWSEVVIDAGQLHSNAGIAQMFGKGVVVHEPIMFLRYVRNAVDTYHEETDLQTRFDQFGWKHNDSAFLYGKMLYTAAGPVEAIGAKEVSTRSQWLEPRKNGSLTAWTEAADSLFSADMEALSAVVLSSFAAPLMKFQAADEGGAILHLFTPGSGMGKTTALTGAWTVWGTREGLNLTNEDTRVAKPITLGTLGNLPVIYDELRDKDPEVIKRMVIMFTEGRDRMRGMIDGTIRHTKANWQTIMLSAANNSLLDQLTNDGTDAPGFRVLELSSSLPKDIDKAKGDRLKRILSDNAGHAGDAYLRYLLDPKVLAWSKQALEQWTREIWATTKLGNEHRFRVRLVGAIAVASALVNKLDVLHFKTDRILAWLVEQLGQGKNTGTVTQTVAIDRAIAVLGEFINEHYGETVVVADRFKPKHARMVPLLKPHNRLSIRYEIATQRIYIAENRFRDWAVQKQLSPRTVLQLLKDHGVIIDFRRNITLSAGTDIPGAQVLCIEANAGHPVMSGLMAAVAEVPGQPSTASASSN